MGEKNIYGLLGRNISYSLSPTMHNAAFRHFSIDAEYRLFDLDRPEAELFLRHLSGKNDISGLNVTVPYKIMARELLDGVLGSSTVTEHAMGLGAVNTIEKKGEVLTGHNTDGNGFYDSLSEDAGFSVKDRDVFICGAGGAGGTICAFLSSLEDERPASIRVFDVNIPRLDELVGRCNAISGNKSCSAVERPALTEVLRTSDLLINATPLGTKEGDPVPFPAEAITKDKVIYDLVYARETEIIRTARDKGATCVNGLGMLINQGAIAFNIWTSMPLSDVKKVMRQAVKEKMKNSI